MLQVHIDMQSKENTITNNLLMISLGGLKRDVNNFKVNYAWAEILYIKPYTFSPMWHNNIGE